MSKTNRSVFQICHLIDLAKTDAEVTKLFNEGLAIAENEFDGGCLEEARHAARVALNTSKIYTKREVAAAKAARQSHIDHYNQSKVAKVA